MKPKQNLVEKIAQRFAVGLEENHTVQPGDYLSISPAHVMTHDNTGAVIPKFRSLYGDMGPSVYRKSYLPLGLFQRT